MWWEILGSPKHLCLGGIANYMKKNAQDINYKKADFKSWSYLYMYRIMHKEKNWKE